MNFTGGLLFHLGAAIRLGRSGGRSPILGLAKPICGSAVLGPAPAIFCTLKAPLEDHMTLFPAAWRGRCGSRCVRVSVYARVLAPGKPHRYTCK